MKRYYAKMLFVLSVLTISVIGFAACGNKQEQGNQTPIESSEEVADWKTEYDLGIRLLGEGNYQEALVAFQAAIKIDPKKADAYVQLAEVYYAMNADQYALEALQNGLDHCEDHSGLLDTADRMGFYIGDDGLLKALSEEERLAKELAQKPVTEQLEYYMKNSTYEFFFEGHISLFGQEVRSMTLDQLNDLARQKGWAGSQLEKMHLDYGDDILTDFFSAGGLHAGQTTKEREKGIGISYLTLGMDEIDLGGSGELKYPQLLSAGMETGLGDLLFGDSLETVLTKLGIEYAAQIAAAAQNWSEDEERRSVQVACFNDAAVNVGEKRSESLSIYYDENDNEGRNWITLNINVNEVVDESSNDRDNSWIYLYFDPENVLWGYSIYNN